MIRFVKFGLIIVFAVLFQVTLFPAYVLDPFQPNLLIILVVYLGLRSTARFGGPAAFVLGLLQDCFSGIYLGLNGFSHLPDWIAVGIALIASLWTDAIVFSLISDLGTPDFLAVLPGDVLGKTISALALWPLVAYYLVRVAPHLPTYVGSQNRRTFDVLSGSLNEVKLALVRTEAALQKSEAERRQEAAYFQQISDHINEALWLATVNQTQAFYVNPAYERIWGRSAASLYADSQSFIDSIHPEDRERVVALLPKQSSGNYDIEFRVIRPDGTIRWEINNLHGPMEAWVLPGNRILIAEVVRALDGVEHVPVPAVLAHVAERSADAALRRDGMRARGKDLRQHGDREACLGELQRGAHAGATGADDDRVESAHRQGGGLLHYRPPHRIWMAQPV